MSVIDSIRGMFKKPYESVSASTASQLVADGAILIDVREPHEWAAGHAPKARHFPLGQLPKRLKEIPAKRPIITVCRSGSRSRRAAALLVGEGHTVSNLTGGMAAWSRAGLPVVARGGRPGSVS